MEEKQHGGGKQRKPADDLSVILHMILRLTELSARRERLLMITFATISGKLSEARSRLCPLWNASRNDNEQLRRSLRRPCLSCVHAIAFAAFDLVSDFALSVVLDLALAVHFAVAFAAALAVALVVAFLAVVGTFSAFVGTFSAVVGADFADGAVFPLI